MLDLILQYIGGREDFYAWCKWKNRKTNFKTFLHFIIDYPEYRLLLKFRISRQHKYMFPLLKIFLYLSSKSHNLYLMVYGKCGDNLLLQHAFSTIITARSIGKNCHIYQQVTIGWNTKGCPVIGDDVQICCGAKVLGDIKVGDDVIIGANAVVVKDIPSHSIVVGIPARVIKRRKNIEDDWVSISSDDIKK